MDRNISIEVSSEKEKRKVLEKLRDKGEPVNMDYGVTPEWCYLVFELNEWVLRSVSKGKIFTYEEFMNVPKFEVGKWYSNPAWVSTKDFVKYIKHDTLNVYYKENISAGVYRQKFEVCSWCSPSTMQLADMEEVSKYLPNGHPDKIIKFKEGDWVVVLPEDRDYYNCEKCLQKIASINNYGSNDVWYSLLFKNGTTNSYQKIRMATEKEINAKEQKRNLLDKVKEKFRIGDSFISVINGKTYTIEEAPSGWYCKASEFDDSQIFAWTNELTQIIAKGDIISEKVNVKKTQEEEEEELLKKAKRLYPVGTKYRGILGGSLEIAEREPRFLHGKDIDVGIDYIYYDGTWADVVEEHPTTTSSSPLSEIIGCGPSCSDSLCDYQWEKGEQCTSGIDNHVTKINSISTKIKSKNKKIYF